MSKEKKGKRARGRHAAAVRVRTTEKLKAWHFKHKDDAEYRAKRAAGSRKHLERLYRDAEFGRMARAALTGFGSMLTKLAALSAMQEEGETGKGGEE